MNKLKKEENVEEFQNKYFKNLSFYFNRHFKEYFKNIVIESSSDSNGIIVFHLTIDDRSANPLNIVHGGALASLIENLSSSTLFYFTGKIFKTLDISINYKNQVDLNKLIKVVVNCQKINKQTCFVEVEVRDEKEIFTEASLIKSVAIKAKF